MNEFCLIHINSLYDIFQNDERNLENHDKAYEFIIKEAEKQNTQIFILIGSINMKKFKKN